MGNLMFLWIGVIIGFYLSCWAKNGYIKALEDSCESNRKYQDALNNALIFEKSLRRK